MRALKRLAGFVGALVLLAGCGGEAAELQPQAQQSSADIPAFSDVPDTALPAVSGEPGAEPTVRFPDSAPPSGSARRILREGTGDPVEAGDVLVSHHLGLTWDDRREFDLTWDDGRPAAWSMNRGDVIDAWFDGLVGIRGGSRVLLVVSPDKGYGEVGLPEYRVSGSDVLVYVIDVLGRHAPGETASGEARTVPPDLPTLTDTGSGVPNVVVAARPPPADARTALVIAGDGPVVRHEDVVVAHYTATEWTESQPFLSTWDRGAPERVVIGEGAAMAGGAEEALEGVAVGSRVLVVLPPEFAYGDAGLPQAGVGPDATLVYVVDVLGAYRPAEGSGDHGTEPEDDGHGHNAE